MNTQRRRRREAAFGASKRMALPACARARVRVFCLCWCELNSMRFVRPLWFGHEAKHRISHDEQAAGCDSISGFTYPKYPTVPCHDVQADVRESAARERAKA